METQESVPAAALFTDLMENLNVIFFFHDIIK